MALRKPTKPKTNVDMLRALIKEADSDVLLQIFIIDYLGRAAKTVSDAHKAGRMWKPGESFVNPDAWAATANKIVDAYTGLYGPNYFDKVEAIYE